MTSTEEKLQYLSSQYPEAETGILLDLLISCDGDTEKVAELVGEKKPTSTVSNVQSTLKRYLDEEYLPVPKISRTQNKNNIITIYNSDQLKSLDLPLTITRNFLPRKLADELLRFMIDERPKFNSQKFHLFGRPAQTKSTSCVYSEYPERPFSYQGRQSVLKNPFNDILRRSRDLIQDKVNAELELRKYLKFQYFDKWNCDVIVANHYENSKSCLGYHSDQMTHIGPQAIIAGLSLGVTRQFLLRPRNYTKKSPIISIEVPHNCLIIMHGNCQELFKHSIPAASGPFEPHPISNQSRFSLTFRMYRPEYALDKIPYCPCKLPMILRTTQSDDIRYIWQCSATYREDEGCSQVLYPKFTRDDMIGLGEKYTKQSDIGEQSDIDEQ